MGAIGRKVIQAGDLLRREQGSLGRVGVQSADRSIVEAEDAFDDVGEISRDVDEAVPAAVPLPRSFVPPQVKESGTNRGRRRGPECRGVGQCLRSGSSAAVAAAPASNVGWA